MAGIDLEQVAKARQQRQHDYACRIFCCASTGCISSGSEPVIEAIRSAVQMHGIAGSVEVVTTGCMGLCGRGPLVRVEVKDRPSVLYKEVEPLVARLIVAEHVLPCVRQHDQDQCRLPAFLEQHTLPMDMPFFSRQFRVVLSRCGDINPDSIEDYVAAGGYSSLRKALLEMSPQDVIDCISRSGLRGRGGAGYPTGLKWANTRQAPSGDGEKFIICNGDEGDPGAYMDRSVLEGDPHAVIEGMMIAGYAVGASQGWFYIRAEYPLAVERVEKAVRLARRSGLLGKNIFGSGFHFDAEVRLGAGAFVCGEETALINSIEGKRGTPIPRPPYPSLSGLWGKPTCVNNVETLANVPQVIARGAEWFASMGTETSKGTKVFSLAGKVRNVGIIEVPMGTPLRAVIEEIGGGPPDGAKLKAVQTGGPSGGVIPADRLDAPVCYEALREIGSMMGSGGMIVLDESDSMVEIAAFYLGFTVDESCGKCVPCRVGGFQMLSLLRKILDGRGSQEDLDHIRRLAHTMRRASLCGLGQTAPNPVMSTMRYFPQEYEQAVAPPRDDAPPPQARRADQPTGHAQQ